MKTVRKNHRNEHDNEMHLKRQLRKKDMIKQARKEKQWLRDLTRTKPIW